jgi:hypothetical protein
VFSLATDAAPGRPNEDFVLATADLAVVVDGGGDSGACSHGVPWFARQLGTHTVAALVDEPDLPLAEALGRGIRAVSRMHVYSCDLSSGAAPTATVGLIRVRRDAVDVLALGDCVVLVDTDAGPQITRDVTGGEPRTAGAQPQAAHQAVTNSYPRGWVRSVAALSDGAARPAERAGWPQCLDLLARTGAGTLLRHTRSWQQADPTGPDDATIAHATLTHP